MEAKNESTLYFAEKTGDKLFIEIEITGNPDEVVSKILKSFKKQTELFEGAKCSQVLFKGRSVDGIIKEASDKAIQSIKYAITDMFNNISELGGIKTQSTKDTITGIEEEKKMKF